MPLEVVDGVLRVAGAFDATGEVLLSEGRVLSSTSDSAAVQLRVSADTVQLAFRNVTDAPVRVEQLRPLVAHSGFRSLPVGNLQIGGLGWQSWSRAYPPSAFEANSESAGPPIRGPYLPHRGPDSQVEIWMASLSPPRGDPLLLGFTQAEQQLSYVEIKPGSDRHVLIAACELEGVELGPGEEVLSEPLLILSGSEPELRTRYAEAVAATMHPRIARSARSAPAHGDPSTSSGEPWAGPLSGWCSWYQLYTTVSEADVRRNLSNLSEHAEQLPLRLIQLDDGFQRAVGDWLDINDKFSPSLRGLASDIRVAGFMPGLWLAPFLLSANSRTYAEHPDWVIRRPTGEPVNALHNWGAANFCLDTTHPAALDWICEVILIVTEDWGFEYLKLDFLYAAAVRGIRHDPSVTSVQAYRTAMRRIREVVGERFILGCGAPLLPSIGLVDGMRIGSDVAGYWGREGNSDGPSLSNALGATLARCWLHGKWWTNDPDCVIVRGHDTELTLDEVQAWAAVVALSGGMFFVGDDLVELEPDRLAILSRLVPPSGVAASASAPVYKRMSQRLHLRFRGHSVVGIANWSDTPTPSAFDPAQLDLPVGIAYHLFDLWRGDYLGRTAGPRRLPDLPPHALHLLAVHADEGHPRVVGSTGHLLGPAMDVAQEAWDPVRRELVVTPTDNGPKSRAGEIVVADSSGTSWRLPLATARPEPMHFSCE